MFYCGWVVFTAFKPVDIKSERYRVISSASLDDNGRSTRNGSRFQRHIKVYVLTFTGTNWKCHVITVIKKDLSGFVVTMHPGLCEQNVQSNRTSCSHVPSRIVTAKSFRANLNLLIFAHFQVCCGCAGAIIIERLPMKWPWNTLVKSFGIRLQQNVSKLETCEYLLRYKLHRLTYWSLNIW